MGRRAQRAVLITGIFAVAFLGLFAMLAMRPEPPKREQPNLAMLVDAIVLEASAADIVIRSQGTVMPRTETVLSAEVSGTIDEHLAEIHSGRRLRKGRRADAHRPAHLRCRGQAGRRPGQTTHDLGPAGRAVAQAAIPV